MSILYNRQVAQTRSAQPAEKTTLELSAAEMQHLIQLLERDVDEEAELVRQGYTGFNLLRSKLLLEKCQQK
jgi:hypothetical protein